MNRLTAIAALSLGLFSTAFVAGKGGVPAPDYPDSLRSVWLYTEGIKRYTISQDSVQAKSLFEEAIRLDSTFAPAYYELVNNNMYASPEEAVALSETAYRLDTTNKWYHRLYGQSLIYAGRYKKAQAVFRRLQQSDSSDPDNYRILAALYEQNGDPYSAIITLDSAEVRFGRIPYLNAVKRQLLIATNQLDKAISEAKAMVDNAPYEAQYHSELATLYGQAGRDSLAINEYGQALAIDSTNLATLMSMADFHTERRDYRSLLEVSRRLFTSELLPLDTKIKRFEQFTSDTRFYREYYPQINILATTLAIRYPNDARIVELYGRHLIASGELPQALTLYKNHLNDLPPVEDFYRTVIDIESYLQHPDSVNHYVDRALALFPDKVDFHMSKGHVMGNLKQYDRAIKAYKQSLHYTHSDSLRSVIWGMIGDTWHQKAIAGQTAPDELLPQLMDQLGKRGVYRNGMKESYKAYDKSLSYMANNALVLNNYAYFLSLEGRDMDRALSMATQAVALTDNNPTYLDTQAWVLFKLGRAAEAKKIMQQAIALDRQGSSELLVHYGDILDALGERFLAETYWRKALDKGYDATSINKRLNTSKKE